MEGFCGRMLIFSSRTSDRTCPWNTRRGSHPVLVWQDMVKFRTAFLTLLCHNDLRLLLRILFAIVSEISVRSSTPIVCSCLVVACSMLVPRTSAASLITWDTKADALPQMIVIGKYACLVNVIFMTLANVLASWLAIGLGNNYLEVTSMTVTVFSSPPDGSSSGTKKASWCLLVP